jgi:hypothetical protein
VRTRRSPTSYGEAGALREAAATRLAGLTARQHRGRSEARDAGFRI